VRLFRISTLASLFVVPLALTLAAPALASEQTGKLAGNVFDPDGVPLAGVTITITSDNLMGQRQNQTAEDGSFLFFGLPPGKYSISIEQPGFLPFKQEMVRISIGGTVTLDILLELPTAEETVVVTARRPVVDKEKTSLGGNYDDEFLENIPISRQYQSVANLAPGVIDNGSGNPNVHGGSLYSNQYLVDGVNTTDPVTNTFAANFNFDAIKEVQVLTGGLDAEYGQSTGGIINLVTKSGGNEFQLDASFYAQPDAFIYKDSFEKDGASSTDMYQFNINIGGPILKDKLWYFASIEIDRNVTQMSATPDYFDPANPDKIQHPTRNWFSVYYLAKLTFQATDKHKITAMTQGDPTWLENEDQDNYISSEAETQRYQGGYFAMATWEALWTKNLFQKTMLGYTQSILDIYPMGCRDNNDPQCRSHYDSVTGLTTGNSATDYLSLRNRLQFDSAWTYYLDDFLGDHEWKLGWQYAHTWQDLTEGLPGGASYTDQGGQPYRIKELARNDQGEYEKLKVQITGEVLGVYLQDAWKITKNLTFKPGLRIDWAQMRNYDDKVITEFLTTSPRINLVWDITGDGKTVMRAGYNRYVDSGYLMISDFVGKSQETNTYEYNPATQQYDIFVRHTGGDDGVVVKDNLTAPHVDEVNLQLERELFTDFSLAVNGLWRQTMYIFEDDESNLIWNREGTDVIGYKNGQETYIWSLGTPREAWRRYWGFELVARKAFSDNWQMSAFYTYSRAEGAPDTLISSYLDNPRQNKFFWSWLGYDRRHNISVDGSYRMPYGIELGASIFWRTGYPYSKAVMNDYWGSYSNYEAPAGYDREHPNDPYWNRTFDIFQLDIKLVWDLKELTGQQLDIIGEFINVLHLRDKTGLVTTDYPAGNTLQYGDYTAHRSGFQAALGLRYRY
jgi:hypothetical protein